MCTLYHAFAGLLSVALRRDREENNVLVLTRLKSEVIIIDGKIEVTVLDVRGDRVKLGISAPAEISVHRKEVYDAIQQARAACEEPAAAHVTEE